MKIRVHLPSLAVRRPSRQVPDLLGPGQIRVYQLFLTTERQLAPASIRIAVSSLRFLHGVSLHKDWDIP